MTDFATPGESEAQMVDRAMRQMLDDPHVRSSLPVEVEALPLEAKRALVLMYSEASGQDVFGLQGLSGIVRWLQRAAVQHDENEGAVARGHRDVAVRAEDPLDGVRRGAEPVRHGLDAVREITGLVDRIDQGQGDGVEDLGLGVGGLARDLPVLAIPGEAELVARTRTLHIEYGAAVERAPAPRVPIVARVVSDRSPASTCSAICAWVTVSGALTRRPRFLSVPSPKLAK